MTVAVVTGGTGGIGAAIVERLARDGYAVAFGYRSHADRAAQLVDAITAEGGRVTAIAHAVETAAGAEALVAHARETLGADPEVAVHCAGALRDQFLRFLDEDAWDEVMAVNVKGALHLLRAVLPGMRHSERGRIVHIGSDAGRVGAVRKGNYAASKAALHALTQTAALELAPQGITVNTVSPGLIDTDRTLAYPESTREAIIRRIPLKRAGRPQEVAHVVAALVALEAGFITGQCISVNGGMLMG